MKYRLAHEILIQPLPSTDQDHKTSADSFLNNFKSHRFKFLLDGSEHFALSLGILGDEVHTNTTNITEVELDGKPEISRNPSSRKCLVFAHKATPLTDVFGRNRDVLDVALKKILAHGCGVLLYLCPPVEAHDQFCCAPELPREWCQAALCAQMLRRLGLVEVEGMAGGFNISGVSDFGVSLQGEKDTKIAPARELRGKD